MLGTKRLSGFTLIELLIALVIIGLLAAAVIPYMEQLLLGRERNNFVTRLNAVAQTAWQQAVITGVVHRIVFHMQERSVSVERDVTKSVLSGVLRFEPLTGVSDAQMIWSPLIEIKQFFVEGFDEMRRFGGRRSEIVWFYLIPDGMTQAVIINFVDKGDMINAKPKQFGLVLNPFFAQFRLYDVFQH